MEGNIPTMDAMTTSQPQHKFNNFEQILRRKQPRRGDIYEYEREDVIKLISRDSSEAIPFRK